MLRPGEDEIALDAVTHERRHGNASVLDLGMAQESDGAVLAHTVEIALGETHRIVEFDDGVKLPGNIDEVGFRLGHLNRRGDGSWCRSERRNGSERCEKYSGLHLFYLGWGGDSLLLVAVERY